MATGSPVREYTTEELDAMAAAELPAFEQPAPAAAPGPVRGPAMGPVAQLEADREYTTEELDLLEKSSAPPPPQEFTTEELDMEAARLFDDPSYAPTRDEYFELKATKERLTAEGKLPGTAELAAKAVGGFVVTALDAFNTAVYSPLETASKSAATLQTGVGRAALGAMQLGGWVTEAMRGAPKYRDEETGEFLWVSDGDSRQLQQALDAGRKLRPTTDEDLKDYEFENYIAKKGIDAEYQALGEKTAPTELLTRLVTGRNQQETPNLSQASVIEMGADPFNLLPFGAGFKAIGLSRLGKTVSAKTAGVIGKVAGGVADGGDALANRFTDVVANATGFTPRDLSTAGKVLNFGKNLSIGGGIAAGANAIGMPPEVTATIAGFYPAYKAGIGVLRKIETGAGAAKIILRESADATNGLDQAARAAVLANPSVPQVFKEVLERPSNFVPIESTPARLAAEQALSPQMRGLMGKLANPAIVQSVRGASALAKGAVKGTAINAPFSLLAANAGDDEEAAAMLGAGAAFGALGGGVDRFTGLQQRRQQAAISDVSRMLVDVELAGGDVGKLMSTQTPESLVKLASLQGTFRNGLDFIPLNATDYNANVAANGGAGSAGLFVQAPAGERAKVYINLDAKRQGIEPHEFGHALLASGALDGQQKFAARAWVDKTYGAEGIKARAAEYASNIIRAKNAEAFPEGNFEITPTTLASEIDNLAQGGLARGDMDGLDWARDEIFAETFAKASETMDFNAIRRGAPAGGNFLTFAEGILGAQARALSASGVRIDPQTGAPLEKPADLFAKNPLLATDKALVKQLGTYINNYRQWANNPGHEKPAGVRVAPRGRASDIANNPQVTFYDRGDGIKANAFAIQDPTTGQAILRDQRDLNAEHAKVREQLRALGGSRLRPDNDPYLGPRKEKDSNRTPVRGKLLPPQFDFLNGFMPHIRNFARQFEQFGQTGESMQVRYHAIGSGDTGAFRIKNLGNLQAITREVIPFEWQLTKAGNLNAVVLDLTQFRNRAMRAINNRNEALAPFNFEIGQLEADLKVWMDNHRNNLPGENKIGTAKRDAINALVGLATTQNRAKNPLNGAFGPGSAIKQFRLDRVDAAIGTGRTGFHFDYDKANGNLLPEVPTPLPDLSRDLPPAKGQAMPDAVRLPQWQAARQPERLSERVQQIQTISDTIQTELRSAQRVLLNHNGNIDRDAGASQNLRKIFEEAEKTIPPLLPGQKFIYGNQKVTVSADGARIFPIDIPVSWARPNLVAQKVIETLSARSADLQAELYLAMEAEGGRSDRLAAKTTAQERDRQRKAAEFAALLDARDQAEKTAAESFVSEVWNAFAEHDENFQFGRTDSADAAEIAKAVSTPGRTIFAEDRGSAIRFSNSEGSLTVNDADTDSPYIRSTDAKSQGKEDGGGKQLYAAALDWIHNNDKQIVDDTGLTAINAIRRTSNFLASALRWGTTKHLKPHAEQNLRWTTSDQLNIAEMATKEMDFSLNAVPEARDWTYDFANGKFRDQSGKNLSRKRLESAVRLGDPKRTGVGMATLQRAIITRSAIQAFKRGETARSFLESARQGIAPATKILYTTAAGAIAQQAISEEE